MQLLLVLAAYLLVTAVLKSTLDVSQRTCCILAVGERLRARNKPLVPIAAVSHSKTITLPTCGVSLWHPPFVFRCMGPVPCLLTTRLVERSCCNARAAHNSNVPTDRFCCANSNLHAFCTACTYDTASAQGP